MQRMTNLCGSSHYLQSIVEWADWALYWGIPFQYLKSLNEIIKIRIKTNLRDVLESSHFEVQNSWFSKRPDGIALDYSFSQNKYHRNGIREASAIFILVFPFSTRDRYRCWSYQWKIRLYCKTWPNPSIHSLDCQLSIWNQFWSCVPYMESMRKGWRFCCPWFWRICLHLQQFIFWIICYFQEQCTHRLFLQSLL